MDQINVIIRNDAEKSRIIDISDAVAGLSSDITPLYDGTLTIMRSDLAKL